MKKIIIKYIRLNYSIKLNEFNLHVINLKKTNTTVNLNYLLDDLNKIFDYSSDYILTVLKSYLKTSYKTIKYSDKEKKELLEKWKERAYFFTYSNNLPEYLSITYENVEKELFRIKKNSLGTFILPIISRIYKEIHSSSVLNGDEKEFIYINFNTQHIVKILKTTLNNLIKVIKINPYIDYEAESCKILSDIISSIIIKEFKNSFPISINNEILRFRYF